MPCAATVCTSGRRSSVIFTCRTAVYERAAAAPRADLVLVCVKTYQTAGILDDLASAVADTTVVVTLQNGVESDEVVASRFGWPRVVPAAVYVGATLDDVVEHATPARISIGARTGFDPDRLPAVREVLASTGQPVQISPTFSMNAGAN